MRKVFIFSFVCGIATLGFGQGIDFFQGKWDEALKLAQEQNKIIFVDAYTTWCGPCKRMSAQVFPVKEVGDYYNANFINMKLDMERGEGLKFKQKYTVTAYPTFFWIDGDGQVVHTTKGARQVKDFIELGKTAAKKYDGSAKYKVQYDAGARDFETVYNYVIALNKAGKSSLKVTNEYLKDQSDLSTPDNLRLILEGATHVDSKVFGYLVEHKKEIAGMEGNEAVDERIRAAAGNTVARAVKYESGDLLEEAVAAMEEHLPDEADRFEIESKMRFAKAMKDGDAYLDHTREFVRKYAGDNAGRLHTISKAILKNFSDHAGLLAFGEKNAKKVCDIHSTDNRVVTYATFVYLNGDKDRAMEIVDEAIAAAQSEQRVSRDLINFKRKLRASS